jgi:glycosidase
VTTRSVRRPLALPWPIPGPERRFHVSLDARRRYGVSGELVTLRGDLMLLDDAVAFALADAVSDAREGGSPLLRGADLLAGALLEEVYHLVVARYLESVDRDVLARLHDTLEGSMGEALREVLHRFLERYPNAELERGTWTPERYLRHEFDGVPGRQVVLEELLTLHLANANPALRGARPLVDDRPLAESTRFDELIDRMRTFWRDEPGLPGHGGSLFDLLLEPMRTAPDDLEAQLRYVQGRWGALLGERFERLVRTLLGIVATLREVSVTRAGVPGPPPLSSFGLRSVSGAAPPEGRFSPDSSWMPQVVLLAKSTYVWLDQLSRAYGRPIERLDAIPEEELAELAGRGFNALWLIGLWERSVASRTIKRLRGQPDAVASAYALYDYAIADDLGGTEALDRLRERASRHGIRLASDMVPNHVGIDGRWVIEHPSWFVSLDHPPYPGYTFDGPDLSPDHRVALRIEDHYYDGSDAAVVFQRVDRESGEVRFIYHGNDGTTMPWNDTAQLDYLQAEVREAVIRTILHVARQFPIIRFDAAMTLAREHVRRLWYPPHGEGGGVPSRGRYGSMDDDAFDERLPEEFWREVVDRVAAEVPDTLLLAEAFWMMEGYFVRSLGMHRVYNSAFMHMLQREANREYRAIVKEVLLFDPQVLKRFVNFLNNPDEETALTQFGDGDKYFAATTLLATMPGMPMFGHGQVEGFREKYGMEYRRPKEHEVPDEALVARHRREIFPLLHRRWQFAEIEGFRLFDVVDDDGGVVEDVYAYANAVRGATSFVAVNNRYERARGRVRESVPFLVGERPAEGEGATRRTTLAEALGVAGGARRFVVMHELVTGLTHLVRSDDLLAEGLTVELDGFRSRVYLDVHELVDHDGALERLSTRLAGRGVPSLVDALDDLRLEGVHAPFVALLDALVDDGPKAARLREETFARFVAEGAVRVATTPLQGPPRGTVARLEGALGSGVVRTALAAHVLLHLEEPLEASVRLRVGRLLTEDLARRGADPSPAALLESVLRHVGAATSVPAAAWLAALLADDTAAVATGRNEYDGVVWFRRESVAAIADVTAALLRIATPGAAAARRVRLWRARIDSVMAASGYRVDAVQGRQPSRGRRPRSDGEVSAKTTSPPRRRRRGGDTSSSG